ATMAAGELIGRPVTLNGQRIGQVADLIGRENTYNDVVIRLDREHSQMGVVLGADFQGLPGNERPIIVGGRTVAVPIESLRPGAGNTIALSESAVTTLDQFRARGGQDFYTYRGRRSAYQTGYDAGYRAATRGSLARGYGDVQYGPGEQYRA